MKKNIEKDSLRQTIMDAAWDLFYKKGYENTTINDIIRQAGTSIRNMKNSIKQWIKV